LPDDARHSPFSAQSVSSTQGERGTQGGVGCTIIGGGGAGGGGGLGFAYSVLLALQTRSPLPLPKVAQP
jgi:hypothetical protein